MLHGCVRKFDVTGTVENFLGSERGLSVSFITLYCCSVLLSGAAFLDGSILEIWKMSNSGVCVFHSFSQCSHNHIDPLCMINRTPTIQD